MTEVIITALVALVLATIAIFVSIKMTKEKTIRSITADAESKIGNAETIAENLVKEAKKLAAEEKKEAETRKKESLLEIKEETIRTKNEIEKESKERREELKNYEKRVLKKEENIEKKSLKLEEKESLVAEKEQNLEKKIVQADKLCEKQVEELEKISRLSSEEAKEQLFKAVEEEVKEETAFMIKERYRKAQDEADKKAAEVIINSIQRSALDHVADATITVVHLPSEEMKGRIIGREGRNIKTLETMTGVELIIDDTPEAVILTGFDPVRREIAKITLERLISDGRIHPARIEEMVEKVRKEVEAMVKEEGENTVMEVGVHGVHPEVIKLLGRMKFRTSYGQNALKHSVEVAHLCGLMAAELGLDIKMAKRAGLLHDIGKSINHEVEGSHVEVGIDICKKYKESDIVINSVASHHGDCEATSMIACLVQAADTISAARPGARRETLEAYTSRLKQLEEITNDFPGIERSFALQAGREIRVMVLPEQVSDKQMIHLARDISKRIEKELDYPGNIKINVIRESRAVDYAK